LLQIGPYQLNNPVVLAPMAGVTDLPFRKLCKRWGAGLVVSEMVSSNRQLLNTAKTSWRMNHSGEPEPRSVQIAGSQPLAMAEAAILNHELGAQIIDINMGCPAKKVCKKAAGSALLKDEALVERILKAVVKAVDIPVTLKIRTGWDTANRNGVRIAKIAADCGIQALAVHGRTRACGYKGHAEYQTISAIKQSVTIPVIANGDITSPQQARNVLDKTGVDGVMIGRAAQGQPWLCGQIAHFLDTGQLLAGPSLTELQQTITAHLLALYEFYGEFTGTRVARKHIGWYLQKNLEPDGGIFRSQFNQLTSSQSQLDAVSQYLVNLLGRSTNQEEQAA
jgi:tRNA-dihydrouridine synthase B